MTMAKIAELAGVSRGAVDKTIHGRPGVRADVRERILRVIEETGYIPMSERHAVQEEHRVKTVAIILPRLTNPYFAALKQQMEELCALMPELKIEYYPCDTTNIQELLSILQSLQQRNDIDGYLFRGVRSNRVREALDASGRPVIFFDSDVPQAKRLCLISEDCVKSGRMAASLLAKSIRGAGQVGVVTGCADIPSHQQRLEGFMELMRTEYPDIQVVRQFYSQEQFAVAYQRTLQLLTDYPHLAGICNLAGCSGEIGQAILEHREQGKVALVCFSTAGDVAELIRKKIVTFSISLQPREQARLMLENMYAYLKHGKKPECAFLTSPVAIALDENIDSLTTDFGVEI